MAATWIKILKDLGVPFTTMNDTVDTLVPLRAGTISATVVSLENALLAQRKDPDLQVGMVVGPPVSRVFGVRQKDAALLREINTYLENMRRSGSWNRLVVKYFGENALGVLQKLAHASRGNRTPPQPRGHTRARRSRSSDSGPGGGIHFRRPGGGSRGCAVAPPCSLRMTG